MTSWDCGPPMQPSQKGLLTEPLRHVCSCWFIGAVLNNRSRKSQFIHTDNRNGRHPTAASRNCSSSS